MFSIDRMGAFPMGQTGTQRNKSPFIAKGKLLTIDTNIETATTTTTDEEILCFGPRIAANILSSEQL